VRTTVPWPVVIGSWLADGSVFDALDCLPGVHHDMHLEAPDRVFELVADVL
jgi:hypothetical protein